MPPLSFKDWDEIMQGALWAVIIVAAALLVCALIELAAAKSKRAATRLGAVSGHPAGVTRFECRDVSQRPNGG